MAYIPWEISAHRRDFHQLSRTPPFPSFHPSTNCPLKCHSCRTGTSPPPNITGVEAGDLQQEGRIRKYLTPFHQCKVSAISNLMFKTGKTSKVTVTFRMSHSWIQNWMWNPPCHNAFLQKQMLNIYPVSLNVPNLNTYNTFFKWDINLVVSLQSRQVWVHYYFSMQCVQIWNCQTHKQFQWSLNKGNSHR